MLAVVKMPTPHRTITALSSTVGALDYARFEGAYYTRVATLLDVLLPRNDFDVTNFVMPNVVYPGHNVLRALVATLVPLTALIPNLPPIFKGNPKLDAVASSIHPTSGSTFLLGVAIFRGIVHIVLQKVYSITSRLSDASETRMVSQ
jgi:hypothetical protein